MRSSGASGFVILIAFWLMGVLALTVFWPSTRPGRVPAISADATLTEVNAGADTVARQD